MSNDKQTPLERYQLKKLSLDLPDFQPDSFEKGECPDFSREYEAKLLGIEIT